MASFRQAAFDVRSPKSYDLRKAFGKLQDIGAVAAMHRGTMGKRLVESVPRTFVSMQAPSMSSRLSARLVPSAMASPPQAANSECSKPRLAVFVSGGGSNFKAIHAAILDGRIPAEVVAVVTDVPGCGGAQYAESHNIPVLTYPIPKKGGFPGLTPDQLLDSLKNTHSADYCLLAGYLKLIPSSLVAAYPRAMLNIHPGLLPAFGGKGMYGSNVHKAVISTGVRFSGPTVHFVDEEFDTGPILAQRVVPVYPTDSYQQVAARVLKEEHLVYPEAVAALVEKRITWREDGVPIMWSAH